MNIILVLILVMLLVVGVGVVLFFWVVNYQQFDDLDSFGIVLLLEDDLDQGVCVGMCVFFEVMDVVGLMFDDMVDCVNILFLCVQFFLVVCIV